MRVLVFRDSPSDWTFKCLEHGVTTWTGDWDLAMECAYGHLCMVPHGREQ